MEGMSMRTYRFVFLAACATAVLAPSASWSTPDVSSFRFTGVVKTICRLEMDNVAQYRSQDVVDFGQVVELCNNRAGYRITMQHPANMQGAIFRLNGEEIPLSAGTETVIVDQNRAAFRLSDAELDLGAVDTPLTSLSFRIDPKGAIY
jgi:hypothetical protein